MKTKNTISELVKLVLSYSIKHPLFTSLHIIDTDACDFQEKSLVEAFFTTSMYHDVINPINIVQNIPGKRDVFQEQVLLSTITTYYREIMSINATEADAIDAVKQLAEAGKHARLIDSLQKSLEYANNTDTTLDEKIAFAEGTFTVASKNLDDSSECSFGEAADRMWADFLNAEEGKGPIGCKTGFNNIDETIGGLFPSETTVVAGLPGSGKTQLMQQVAMNVAENGFLAFIVSLEMTEKQLLQRYLASRLQIPIMRIREGKLTSIEKQDAIKFIKEFKELPIKIEYGRGLSVLQIKSRLMRMVRKYGQPKLIVVDYVQRIKYTEKDENLSLKVISSTLTDLSLELDTHMMILSQLTKNSQRRVDSRPILADLSGSSAVGNDASNVWFTHYQYNFDQTKTELKDVTEVLQRKSRYGDSFNDWQFGWLRGTFRNHIPSMQDRMLTANRLRREAEKEECPFEL